MSSRTGREVFVYSRKLKKQKQTAQQYRERRCAPYATYLTQQIWFRNIKKALAVSIKAMSKCYWNKLQEIGSSAIVLRNGVANSRQIGYRIIGYILSGGFFQGGQGSKIDRKAKPLTYHLLGHAV